MSAGSSRFFGHPRGATLVCTLAATLLVGGAAQAAPRTRFAYDIEKILDNGPDEKRVNIVVLGDGYTADQQDLLTERAQEFIDRFVEKSPFAEHSKWVNAHVVHVISNESGADNGEAGGNRDTALGANFGCAGIDRLLCIDDALVAAVLAESFDNPQIVLISVNDNKYGGAGGTYATFSAAASATDIALHEFAHAYGGLADEYSDPYPGYPECGSECNEANASVFSSREQNKWAHWIDTGTQLPTTGDDPALVGAYEGCRYQTQGVFRPVPNCQMRALGNEFCSVCAEELALRIHAQVNAIDERTPVAESLATDGCSPLAFAITRVESSTAKVTWKLDGQVTGDDADELSLDLSQASAGKHTVEVEVEDLTPLIRRDVDNVRINRASWEVILTPSQCDGTTSGGDETSSTERTTTDGGTQTSTSTGETTPGNGSTDSSVTESVAQETTNPAGENDDTNTVSCSCSAKSSAPATLGWLLGVALLGWRSGRQRKNLRKGI